MKGFGQGGMKGFSQGDMKGFSQGGMFGFDEGDKSGGFNQGGKFGSGFGIFYLTKADKSQPPVLVAVVVVAM